MANRDWSRDVFTNEHIMKFVFPGSWVQVPVPGQPTLLASCLSTAMLRRTCKTVRAPFQPARVPARDVFGRSESSGDENAVVDDATKLAIAEANLDQESDENQALVLMAARSGRVDLIKVMRPCFGNTEFYRITVARVAKAAGEQKVLEYLDSSEAAASGNTVALQWMMQNQLMHIDSRNAMHSCTDVATFQWFCDRGFKISSCTMARKVIIGGHIDVLRAMQAHGAVLTVLHMHQCVHYHQTNMLEVVYRHIENRKNRVESVQEAKRSGELCHIAICYGDGPALRFLLSKGFHMKQKDLILALSEGYEDVVSAVIAHDPPCNDKVFRAAVDGGNVAAIEWACARGWFAPRGALTRAARGGHLAAMKFLHAKGCKWDKLTLLAAKESDSLEADEAAEWLVELGAPLHAPLEGN